MQYRRLGKSGLQVSAISFGSWLTFSKYIDNGTAEKLMHVAYDNGVNFFDNAEGYNNGQSEIEMGYILKNANWNRETFLVSSKVFFGTAGKEAKPNQTGLSRKHVFEACNAALKRFQLEHLDLFFCHRPDLNTPIEETVFAMNQLILQGKILYWGTSEWTAEQIKFAYDFAKDNHLVPPTMEQPQYNLFHREKVEKEFLPLYETVGLGTTIWSPLASGLLSGKYNDGIPKGSRFEIEGLAWLKRDWVQENYISKVKNLSALAINLDITTAQLALAWCLKNKNVSTVITGATRVEQLKENIKSVDALKKLDDNVITEIEKICSEN